MQILESLVLNNLNKYQFWSKMSRTGRFANLIKKFTLLARVNYENNRQVFSNAFKALIIHYKIIAVHRVAFAKI